MIQVKAFTPPNIRNTPRRWPRKDFHDLWIRGWPGVINTTRQPFVSILGSLGFGKTYPNKFVAPKLKQCFSFCFCSLVFFGVSSCWMRVSFVRACESDWPWRPSTSFSLKCNFEWIDDRISSCSNSHVNLQACRPAPLKTLLCIFGNKSPMMRFIQILCPKNLWSQDTRGISHLCFRHKKVSKRWLSSQKGFINIGFSPPKSINGFCFSGRSFSPALQLSGLRLKNLLFFSPAFLGGGNSNIFGIFTPNLGEDEPNLTNVFEMGWNHQLVLCFFFSAGC